MIQGWQNFRAAVVALTLVFSPVAAAEAAELHAIWLQDPNLIADADRLDFAILSVTRNISTCKPQGLNATLRCGCGASNELATLKTALGRMATAHPEWDQPDTVVTYRKDPNGSWTSINLSAVRQMIAFCAAQGG